MQIFKSLFAVFLLAVLSMPANAASLPAGSEAHLDAVSRYLNGIKSIQTEFLQISSTGDTSKGTILLSRPKHLRIDYDPPSPIVIVANGSYLSYVDKELKQVNHIPVEDTPAGFLLRDTFDFAGGDLKVTEVERASNVIRVSVVQAKDPLAGELTLVFTESPMVLRKWTVVDAQGTVTDVTFINPKFDYPIPEAEFEPDFSKWEQQDLGN